MVTTTQNFHNMLITSLSRMPNKTFPLQNLNMLRISVDALEQGDKKCISLLKKHIAWIKEKELKELRKKNLN